MTHGNGSLKEKLLNWGFVYPVLSGIQIDLNPAFLRTAEGRLIEASLCDHNCTEVVGGYDCPAARSYNRGILAKTLAPASAILQGIMAGIDGLQRSRDQYLTSHFDAHCRRFRIPADVAQVLREAFATNTVEVNLFGGNPELHPGVCTIIKELRNQGCRVNLTTTGRRFMRDAAFFDEIMQSPPHVLAVSAGEFEVEPLRQLLGMSLDELRAEWKRISSEHGQQQKACEAVFIGKLASVTSGFPTVLFNTVLDKVNIHYVREIMAMLESAFPNVIINPYPDQEGFHFGEKWFTPEELQIVEEMIDTFIAKSVQGGWLVKRLHYWLLLKAAFVTWRDDPVRIARSIAGYGIWRCYEHPGASRYLQIGRAPVEKRPEQEFPGVHFGCFWNPHTITQTDGNVVSGAQVATHLGGGMRVLAEGAENPCPGCAMPRLLFDLVTTQSGMDEKLTPAFIELRRQHAGF